MIIYYDKIIHQIWLGDKPTIKNWCDNTTKLLNLNKDYDYRLWVDDDDYSWCFNYDLIKEEKNQMSKSDLIRLEVLYKFGGYYCDFDIEWFMPFTALSHDTSKFMCCEEIESFNNAFLYSPPGNYMLKLLIDECKNRSHHTIVPVKYGPAMFNKILRDKNIKIDIEVLSKHILAIPETYYRGKNCLGFHNYRN